MTLMNSFVEFEKTVIPEKIKYELQAFSVYRAVEDFVKGNCPILDVKDEVYYYRRWIKMVANELKQKRLTWYVTNLKRIGRDLQNRVYDKKDLTLTFLFVYYNSKNINLSTVKASLVRDVIEKFSDKQYEKDKQFVLDICKEINIKGIEDFFRIGPDGTSLLYKYIVEKQYISSLFYINLVGKVPTHNYNNTNNNYKKFEKISLAIRELLTTTNK